ncbi:MAG: septum formation initiator family protein [Planctomycetes bacterium]|jgi:cell division protein FtsB|nr:septum formation initiator family protein [Planctomycetota bacterium]
MKFNYQKNLINQQLNQLKQRRPGLWLRIFGNQKALAILLVIILVVVLIPAVKNYQRRLAVNREIAEMKKDINSFTEENNNLKEIVGYLESSQAVEEQARLNLGLKKEGEQVVIIKDERNNNINETIKNQEENLNNPERWFRYFFGRL